MQLKVLNDSFSVCKLQADAVPDWTVPFTFLSCTDEERSLVCPTNCVPQGALVREDGWKAFRIQGELDFSLVGILSRIATLLADKGIAIFAVSTYNTDYLFLKEDVFDYALQILSENGYEILHN